MIAKFKNQVVEVWEVSKTGARPDWVVEAFKREHFVWHDNRLRIRMAFVQPHASSNLLSGLTGGAGGYVAGFGEVVMADDGDFIDRTNGKIVSPKAFAKKYSPIDE
ncbi:MAG: role in replication [Lactococcus sp.]